MTLAKGATVLVGTAGSPITPASSAAASTYASPSAGCQSTAQDISGYYKAGILYRMSPGTGVTTGCTMQVDIAADATLNWRQYASVVSGTTSGETDDGYVALPDEASKMRVTFFGNAGGAVSCDATLADISSL